MVMHSSLAKMLAEWCISEVIHHDLEGIPVSFCWWSAFFPQVMHQDAFLEYQ
jgi:hypothetical protein